MSTTLERVIEEMKTLVPDELQRVRVVIDSLLIEGDRTVPVTEDEFERQLIAEGLVSVVKPLTDFSPYERYKPVRATGKPVSEQIIDERR